MESKVKSLTAQYRYDRWVGIISERNTSGLSINDWCRQNNVKETFYYYWLKKIRHSIVESIDQDDRNGKVRCLSSPRPLASSMASTARFDLTRTLFIKGKNARCGCWLIIFDNNNT